MFDLQYYNKTLHKIEFENIIKEKGLIPIEDLSPIYGICYNEETIKKVDKLLKIDKEYVNKIVFWKLLNDIDETKIKQKLKERNAYVRNENKELLKLLENFQNNFHNSRHPNFAYIQYNERIAYPFDITYNTRNKILVSFKENECNIYINGSLSFTDPSCDALTSLSELNLSQFNNASNFEGKVHDIRVFDYVLSEEEAIALTT